MIRAKSKALGVGLVLALTMSLAACGITVTAVHLPEEIQVTVGATAETAATYETKQEADPAAQKAAADKITWNWKTGDDSVATVDENGILTGVKGGNTIVTVTSADGKFTASCPVTVSQPLQGIALTNLDLLINRTDNAEIEYTLTPTDTTETDITFAVDDPSIAKLNGNKVVAVGNGTTTLTATCGKVRATAKITVETAPTEIQFDSTKGTLTVGNTHTVKATLLPETTTDTELVWSVCNESIATVDAHGTVTAQGPGSCVITAATPDGALKATYELTVQAKQSTPAAVATTPSYTAPSAPSASTPTYVPAPAPAPDPAPAPAEPSQPSGGSSGGGIAGSYGGDYLDQNPEFGYSSGIDWTQDNSCGTDDVAGEW